MSFFDLSDPSRIPRGCVVYSHGPYENGDIYLAKAWCRRNGLSASDFCIRLVYEEKNKEKIESVLVIKK